VLGEKESACKKERRRERKKEKLRKTKRERRLAAKAVRLLELDDEWLKGLLEEKAVAKKRKSDQECELEARKESRGSEAERHEKEAVEAEKPEADLTEDRGGEDSKEQSEGG
jgi:hypothetical protein